MIVACPSEACGRKISVSLASAPSREKVSGLLALSETCARHRINGSTCAAHSECMRLREPHPDYETA